MSISRRFGDTFGGAKILLLAVWDDLDRAEIAQVIGCSTANVTLRLHRARRRFAAAIEQSRLGPICPRLSSSLTSGGADV